MSIEDDLQQTKQTKKEKEKQRKREKQAQKQAEAEVRAQEIKDLKTEIDEIDDKMQQISVLKSNLKELSEDVADKQGAAKEQAQSEVQVAKAEIENEFNDLQDEFGEEVLAENGIEDIDDYREKLQEKDDELSFRERLTDREDRQSEEEFQTVQANRDELIDELASMVSSESEDPEVLMTAAEEEVNKLQERREELYYQTPEGKKERREQIAEKVRERHENDLQPRNFGSRIDNYQIDRNSWLVDPEDITAAEKASENGEEFVKDQIIATHTDRLEEFMDNKRKHEGLDFLEVLESLDKWEKETEKRERFEEAAKKLESEAQELKNKLGEYGLSNLWDYNLIKNKASGNAVTDDVGTIFSRSKRMDKLQRKMERKNINSWPPKVHDIDKAITDAKNLAEAIAGISQTIDEESSEYWNKVAQAGKSRAGSNEEIYNEGMDRLSCSVSIDENPVTYRGSEIDKKTVNERGYQTLKNQLKEKKEEIDEEEKLKKERIKEKVELDFAERKIQQSPGKAIENKQDTIQSSKEDLSEIDVSIAAVKDEFPTFLDHEVINRDGKVQLKSTANKNESLRNTSKEIRTIERDIKQKEADITKLKEEDEDSWNLFGSNEDNIKTLKEEKDELEDQLKEKKKRKQEINNFLKCSNRINTLFQDFTRKLDQVKDLETTPNFDINIQPGMTVAGLLGEMEQIISNVRDLDLTEQERDQLNRYKEIKKERDQAHDEFQEEARK